MMKLKINKIFIKGQKKLKIKRIRIKVEIIKQKRTNLYFLEEKREKKKAGSPAKKHPTSTTRAAPLEKKLRDASNDSIKEQF